MSRNAIALRASDSKKPVRPLRSVSSTVNARLSSGEPNSRIRELKTLALTLLKEVQTLERDVLVSELLTPQDAGKLNIEGGISLDDVVSRFESNIIRQALIITGGNQARAARLLGIKANTLNYKIKLYEL
jgi:DNA-binding NtrC family response regulator